MRSLLQAMGWDVGPGLACRETRAPALCFAGDPARDSKPRVLVPGLAVATSPGVLNSISFSPSVAARAGCPARPRAFLQCSSSP